jgi:hypothetical protein
MCLTKLKLSTENKNISCNASKTPNAKGSGILLLYKDNTEYVGKLRSSIPKHRHINKSATWT